MRSTTQSRFSARDVLEASASLLDRLEAAAGDYRMRLEGVRACHLREGLPSFDELVSPAGSCGANSGAPEVRDLEASSAAFVRGLLVWAEVVGFEYPARGRELAEGAFYAASQMNDERVTARVLMKQAGWKRATGDFEGAAELLDTVMRRGVCLDDALSREFARLYAHLLADSGEFESARLSAGQALSGSSVHERGLGALTLTYVLLREGSMEETLRWHVESLELLSPAAGFPASWQTAVNTLHVLASIGEVLPEDLEEAGRYGDRLAAVSPFGEVSAPALYQAWGRGRILFTSGDAEAAGSVFREVIPGFRQVGLETEALAAAGDLVLAETELGNFEAAASVAASVLAACCAPWTLIPDPKVPAGDLDAPMAEGLALGRANGPSMMTLVY